MTAATFEEIIARQHQQADDARIAARTVVGWSLDHLRLYVGLVEVVEDPYPPLERPLRRRGTHPAPQVPEGLRLLFCTGPCASYNHFHTIKDVTR